MPIGQSGRIVIEVDPSLKRELYSALRQKGLSLKDWLVGDAETYLRADQKQLEIFPENQRLDLKEERAG